MKSNATAAGYYVYRCSITKSTTILHGPYKTSMITSGSLNIVILMFIIILNALVLVVIIKKKLFRTPSYFLLANTTICDLLIGLVSSPLFTVNLFMNIYRTHNCVLFTIVIGAVNLLALMSFCCTWVIGIDRYIAIFKPFYYKRLFSDNNTKYVNVMVGLWLGNSFFVGITIAVSYFNLILLIEGIVFVVCVAMNFYVHIRIYDTGKTVRKEIQKVHAKSKPGQNYQDIRRERKLALVTFLMLVSMVVLYIPYGIVAMLWMAKSEFRSRDIVYNMNQWNFTIISIKSVLNPILYGLTLSKIRSNLRPAYQGNRIEPITTRV